MYRVLIVVLLSLGANTCSNAHAGEYDFQDQAVTRGAIQVLSNVQPQSTQTVYPSTVYSTSNPVVYSTPVQSFSPCGPNGCGVQSVSQSMWQPVRHVQQVRQPPTIRIRQRVTSGPPRIMQRVQRPQWRPFQAFRG